MSYLYSCGKNENGELSVKGFKIIDKPSGATVPKRHLVTYVSSGANHTAYITQDGLLYLFGSTLHGKLGIPNLSYTNVFNPYKFQMSKSKPVLQVACGDYHTLCLLKNGDIYGWGGTLHKKLGNKTSLPSKLPGLDKVIIKKIDCGDFHSAALSENGILFTWGGGGSHFNKGQCGHGVLEDLKTPKPVKFFKGQAIRDFTCGGYHTVVTLEDSNQVFSWGSGIYGELGHGRFGDEMFPVEMQLPQDCQIVQMACGGHHTLLLNNNGQLYSCGNSSYGQTGLGISKNINIPRLARHISQQKDIIQIAAGWNHSLLLVAPYYVYSCGLGQYGQLGQEDFETRSRFSPILKLIKKKVIKIFAGGHHSWFLFDFRNPDIDQGPPSELVYSEEDLNPKKKRRQFNFIKKRTSARQINKTKKDNYISYETLNNYDAKSDNLNVNQNPKIQI